MQHKGLEWERVERDLKSFAASSCWHCRLSLFETPFSLLVINNYLKIRIKMWCILTHLCADEGINVNFSLFKESIAELCSKGKSLLVKRFSHH